SGSLPCTGPRPGRVKYRTPGWVFSHAQGGGYAVLGARRAHPQPRVDDETSGETEADRGVPPASPPGGGRPRGPDRDREDLPGIGPEGPERRIGDPPEGARLRPAGPSRCASPDDPRRE